MKLIYLVVAVLGLAGCAGGPRFQPLASIPADKAVVYVYRPNQVVGLGGLFSVNSPWTVCPNGKNCVSLWQSGYCVFQLEPGTNTFTSSLESPSALLDIIQSHEELCRTNLAAGSVYYLKFGVGAFRAKLRPVDAATATKELVKYKLETL